MILLAADTSTSINTVAVCTPEAVLGETIVEAGRRHSERLLETIQWLLAETHLSPDDLQGLAISIGPGSFTGLRVGVATFKGLAVGLRLPLVGVPTLDAMSRNLSLSEGVVCPMLDARMAEVFAAAYSFDKGRRSTLVDACVGPVEAFIAQLSGPCWFMGNGSMLYASRIAAAVPDARFVTPMHHVPRAAAVAAEAFDRLAAGDLGRAAEVTPVYLRKSQAELNRAALAQER